jgi:hypothetical protein
MGTGTQEIMVPDVKVTAVTACSIYDSSGTLTEALDSDDIADLAIYPYGVIRRRSRGAFNWGSRNVTITYTHGWTSIPADLKRAALMLAMNQLTTSNLSDRTTSYSDGSMNYQLSTAGRISGDGWIQPFGLPEVDTTLRRYCQRIPGIA